MVAEAVAAGLQIIEQYVREDYHDYEADGVLTHELEAHTFNSVSDTETPRGILALVSMPTVEQINFTEKDWALVADGISDPGNLGTMIRSAEAAGVTAIILSGSTVDPWSPKVVRASAGAVFHVPVIQVDDLQAVKKMGLRLLGTTSHDLVGATSPISLYAADVQGRVGIVIGNEAHGLNTDAPIDTWIMIPHAGRSESLNAAMAGTVAVMHIAQSRQAQ